MPHNDINNSNHIYFKRFCYDPFRYEANRMSGIINEGVVTIDVLSIGTKFENFVHAGCRDLGSLHGRTVYCQKPIILPNLVLFFGTFLELPVLPPITCGCCMVLALEAPMKSAFRYDQTANFFCP